MPAWWLKQEQLIFLTNGSLYRWLFDNLFVDPRILTRVEQDQPRLPQKGSERANQLARQVSMERIAWYEKEAGHFEVDMVHHCGISASAHFVHTLQMIDVATSQSERVATLRRSYDVIADGLDERVKLQLQRQRQVTNPRLLRQEIYDDLWRLSQLPAVDPTQS
jgi:hypothetical protein